MEFQMNTFVLMTLEDKIKFYLNLSQEISKYYKTDSVMNRFFLVLKRHANNRIIKSKLKVITYSLNKLINYKKFIVLSTFYFGKSLKY